MTRPGHFPSSPLILLRFSYIRKNLTKQYISCYNALRKIPLHLTWQSPKDLLERNIVMATKTVVAGELYESITGQLFEIGRQLRQPSGYPFNPHLLKLHLQNAVEGKFDGASLIDPRFEYVKEFTLTVPMDYVHTTQLATFEKKHRKDLYYFNSDITDAHFRGATTQLVPGKTYTVKIFGIKKTATSDDCMNLLKSQKAILVGAQGASLVCQEKKEELPKGKWCASFDEKGALWVDAGGSHRVPSVGHFSDGGFKFSLGGFESGWYDAYCVLCFCDGE
jgi:hypothetical protein